MALEERAHVVLIDIAARATAERGDVVTVEAGVCLWRAQLRSFTSAGGQGEWSNADVILELAPGNAPLVDAIAAAVARIEWASISVVEDPDDW
jgi:hypothetical protein